MATHSQQAHAVHLSIYALEISKGFAGLLVEEGRLHAVVCNAVCVQRVQGRHKARRFPLLQGPVTLSEAAIGGRWQELSQTVRARVMGDAEVDDWVPVAKHGPWEDYQQKEMTDE